MRPADAADMGAVHVSGDGWRLGAAILADFFGFLKSLKGPKRTSRRGESPWLLRLKCLGCQTTQEDCLAMRPCVDCSGATYHGFCPTT